jgi:hypothetical protein
VKKEGGDPPSLKARRTKEGVKVRIAGINQKKDFLRTSKYFSISDVRKINMVVSHGIVICQVRHRPVIFI